MIRMAAKCSSFLYYLSRLPRQTNKLLQLVCSLFPIVLKINKNPLADHKGSDLLCFKMANFELILDNRQ